MQSPHSSPPQWQRRWQDRIALWQSIHTPVESTNFMNCRLWPGWEFLVRQIPCCHFVSNNTLGMQQAVQSTLRFMKFQAAFRTEAQRDNSTSLLLPSEHHAWSTPQLFILSFAMCKWLLCLLCRYVFKHTCYHRWEEGSQDTTWMLLEGQHKSSSLLVEISRLQLLY